MATFPDKDTTRQDQPRQQEIGGGSEGKSPLSEVVEPPTSESSDERLQQPVQGPRRKKRPHPLNIVKAANKCTAKRNGKKVLIVAGAEAPWPMKLLSYFPHLTMEAMTVNPEDVFCGDLIVDSFSTDIEDLDYGPGKIYHPDSQSVIDWILADKRVYAPIFITRCTPSEATNYKPFRAVDGRTRTKGAIQAKLDLIDAICFAGFRSVEEEKAFGIRCNGNRRSNDDSIRKAYLYQLVAFEEREIAAGRQDHPSSFSVLSSAAGFKKGGHDIAKQHEIANWYGRFVAWDNGDLMRRGADGRPQHCAINDRHTPIQRWTVEQIHCVFSTEGGEMTDEILKSIEDGWAATVAEHETKPVEDRDPQWHRHTKPRYEDAVAAANMYNNEWREAVARKALEEEAAKDQSGDEDSEIEDEDPEDPEDQEDREDREEGKDGTSTPAEFAKASANLDLFNRFGNDLIQAVAWLDICPQPTEQEWQTKLSKVGYAVALWFRFLANTTGIDMDTLAKQRGVSEDETTKLVGYYSKAISLIEALGEAVK